MTEATEATRTYLKAFERLEKDLSRVGSPALHRLRKAALAHFAELGFPGPRDEEWRFTSVAPLVRRTFEPAPDQAPPLAELPGGVLVGSLAEALRTRPELVEAHLGRHADFKGHAFTALNTAFLRDGLFVFVPPGAVVEAPIDLRFDALPGPAPAVWRRRCLVVVGDNAQATLVESYRGGDAVYFTNAVTEVVVGKHAVVDHYKLQQEGKEAFHMASMQVQLDRAGVFSSQSIALGGAWVRNEVNAVFAAEGGECTLNGLYQASGQQLIDNHTFIDHAQPRCASHELYKGILDGKARGVFNGKIYVRQDAQKTDAKQTNQTLLLSDDATINTKPQLEIYADDVKCTHGATVGQLDEDALFYLRARGIGREQARSLLTYAFANDIINRIKVAPLRQRLEQAFLDAQQLPRAETAEEKS